jgi:hypothetical protein
MRQTSLRPPAVANIGFSSSPLVLLQILSWNAIQLYGSAVVIASQAKLQSVVHKESAAPFFHVILELVIDRGDGVHRILGQALKMQYR